MPNRLLHIPRYLLIFLLILVVGGLLVGSLHAFVPAHAQDVTSPTPTAILTNTPTVTALDLLDAPPADTTGIIVQAIILAAIVMAGAFWGWRMSVPRRHRNTKD